MAKTRVTAEEQLAGFLARGRSVSDIANQFDLNQKDARAAVRRLVASGYDVVHGPPNIHGDETFVAVPSNGFEVDDSLTKSREWRWSVENNGQPYGAVTFPSTYEAPKIKIVPIDGILYGSPAHDAERFDALIERLAAEEHTFCFLNGDIINEIQGGSREDRERLLLELAGVFITKMQPIAHKVLWAQQGCLEARSAAHQGFDPLEYFCQKLGIPYFKEPTYIDINWGEHTFTLWAMHGQSAAQTKGARINSLRRPGVIHEWTHFIIAGHIGDAMWNRNIKIVRDPVAGRLVPKEEFYVILGNFKKFLGTPSARRGHQPPSNEILILNLYPNGEHHVKTAHLSEVGK